MAGLVPAVGALGKRFCEPDSGGLRLVVAFFVTKVLAGCAQFLVLPGGRARLASCAQNTVWPLPRGLMPRAVNPGCGRRGNGPFRHWR
jgi:hypothetical protein